MLQGVYIAQHKDKSIYFRANITYRNKHISLGSYESEQEAHQAYLDASDILFNSSITLDTVYFLPTVLHFDKRVSLLNFRDNHIYFKNPIYLKNNYFIYFISAHDELKFDIDDLFYYSSHKIMRRKGHLFVSDYGMQVTILSRYGIKNFAICPRDYYFVNGDSSDFRYSNIKIINKYYGVTQFKKMNQMYFKAKINIVGSHVIGVYPTEELAAIAYNKAIDLIKKHGIQKNYTSNYIDEFSPSAYAQAYTSIKISPRLLTYLQNDC